MELTYNRNNGYGTVVFDNYILHSADNEIHDYNGTAEDISAFEIADVCVCPACIKRYGLYFECDKTSEELASDEDYEEDAPSPCGVKGCDNPNGIDGILHTKHCSLREEITTHYGLTEERYNQMMEFHGNNDNAVREVVEEQGADSCNNGYDVFDYDYSGLLIVLPIDDVGAYTDEQAIEVAAADGIKTIPVEELPANMPDHLKIKGWVDTPENKERIAKFCEDPHKKTKKQEYYSKTY